MPKPPGGPLTCTHPPKVICTLGLGDSFNPSLTFIKFLNFVVHKNTYRCFVIITILLPIYAKSFHLLNINT